MPIHIPFPHLPGYSLSSIYTGNGSDGTVIIDSPITFSRDMHYHNVIILGAGSVDTNGYMFFADGYLDLTNAGAYAIHANGISGSGMAAGQGRVAHTVGGSGAGGVGTRPKYPYAPYYETDMSGFSGVGANSIYQSNGGYGASGQPGGASSAFGASSGGYGGSVYNEHVSAYNTYNRYMYYSSPLLTQGGAGGGGGGSGSGIILCDDVYLIGGAAGGGGGGGGVVGVFVNQLRIGSSTATSAISAIGGEGGLGSGGSGMEYGGLWRYSGNGGNGGQGGGGFVYVCYNTKSGSTTNIINVSGLQAGCAVVYNGQTKAVVGSVTHGSGLLSI